MTTPAPQATRAVWRTVFEALENERCLDLRYRTASTELRDDDPVPNYKVMKQLALRRRLGLLYRPAVALARVLILLAAPLQWSTALAAAAVGRSRGDAATMHIVATAPGNVALIEAALLSDPEHGRGARDSDLFSLRMLGAELGCSGVLLCVASHLRILGHILGSEATLRSDLLLHACDAFVLTMLALYAKRHPSHQFATEDHYQRWVYLLSHQASDLRVVQHGFVDDKIGFTHHFGAVRTLYLRDPMFGPQFGAYYMAREQRVFAPLRPLQQHPFAGAVFLASSFPTIDDEIELVRALKAQGVPVVVKLHPAHHYEARGQTLTALADGVISDDVHPACAVFVSHSSFMEFDYRARDIPTYSIAREGGPLPTAKAILAAFTAALEPTTKATKHAP